MNNDPDPSRIYCPECGGDGEKAEEASGYFSPFTYIVRCPFCGALIEDGCFLSTKPPK